MLGRGGCRIREHIEGIRRDCPKGVGSTWASEMESPAGVGEE